MTDEQLLHYCEAHCRTERALFHRDQIKRLYELAGHTMSGDSLPEWIVARPAIVDPVVSAARARRAAAAEAPC